MGPSDSCAGLLLQLLYAQLPASHPVEVQDSCQKVVWHHGCACSRLHLLAVVPGFERTASSALLWDRRFFGYLAQRGLELLRAVCEVQERRQQGDPWDESESFHWRRRLREPPHQ